MNKSKSPIAARLDIYGFSTSKSWLLLMESVVLFVAALTLHLRWNYVWIAVVLLIKVFFYIVIGSDNRKQMSEPQKPPIPTWHKVGVIVHVVGIIVLGYVLYFWRNPEIHSFGYDLFWLGAIASYVMPSHMFRSAMLLLVHPILPFLYLISQKGKLVQLTGITREVLPGVILSFCAIVAVLAVISLVTEHFAKARRTGL